MDGDTVFYSDWELIPQTLDYDFNAERDFDYSTLSKDDVVRHITRFIANIWQVHAFGEGNTRTTAVFAIKYLRALGFDAANKPFGENSWYFRNALVRANYTNVRRRGSICVPFRAQSATAAKRASLRCKLGSERSGRNIAENTAKSFKTRHLGY